MIPVLRQSLVPIMSCPEGYDFQIIQGNPQSPSMPSNRGSEVHAVMSQYSDYCVRKRVPADWSAFDVFAGQVSLEAGRILDGMRMTYIVDWQHIYGTELKLALTDDLLPTRLIVNEDGSEEWLPEIPGVRYSDRPAAVVGTLDVLKLMTEQHAIIDDAKSHPKPFEANTFQSKLYALFVFQHFPRIERVDFNLIFVRYAGCVRNAMWTRDQVPDIATEVQRMRRLQRSLHSGMVELKPIPGAHCWYCPKAATLTCSLGTLNPEMALSLEERTRQQAWMEKVIKMNKSIIHNAAEAGYIPSFTDAKGNKQKFANVESEAITYPLDRTTVQVLEEWSRTHRGDDPFTWGLTINSSVLKQRLDTKMRTSLRESFENSIIEVETRPQFKIVGDDPEAEQEEMFDDSF